MSDATTDLVSAPPSITSTQRVRFAPEQVALIRRQCVPPDASEAEFAQFLEIAARHELDPLLREIWSIRMTARGPVQTVVAKDGLLKVANRWTGAGWANQPGEFLGVTSGAVHADDLYKRDRYVREDGTIGVLVQHTPAGERFGGVDMNERGQLVGSWAICRRRGHDDVFFEAPRKEYDKKRNAWETHPHAMICKVAEAVVLRKAFPIAGVNGEGELDRVSMNASAPDADAPATDEIVWPVDEKLADDLKEGFRQLGYRRAKVRALVNACTTADEFVDLLEKLHAEVDSITDAEVVDA